MRKASPLSRGQVRTAKAEIVDPDRGVEHASGGARHEDERQLFLRVRRIDLGSYAVLPDPLVEIIVPPDRERRRIGLCGAIGIGRLSDGRGERQSGRVTIESVGEGQREREQEARLAQSPRAPLAKQAALLRSAPAPMPAVTTSRP